MTEHVEILENEENSSDADESDISNEDDDQADQPKSGLANVMAKILQKKVPKHQQVILYKATTDKELSRKRKANDETDEAEILSHKDFVASQEKKKVWEEMGRIKPDALDRVKERNLRRIAQRGVVQLFNAVRRQQKIVEEKVAEAGPSERKKDKVLQTMTKGKFLDLLKGAESNVKSEPVDIDVTKVKTEPEDEESSQWSVLKDNFMMGAKMKDWDKDSDPENGSHDSDNDDDSDSDAG